MKNYLDLLNSFNNTQPVSKPVETEVPVQSEKKVSPPPTPRPKPEIKKKEESVKPKIEENKETPKPKVLSRVEELKKKPLEKKQVESAPSTSEEPKYSTKTFSKPAKPVQAPQAPIAKSTRPMIEYPKISIIMQTYLGDYPGSRVNSEMKFKRAVASFIKQSYENCELIIVSDGCEITHRIWIEEIKGIDRIKYAYVDKSGANNMYEKNQSGEKIYRGIPRAVGVTVSSGDIITYCDSDDFMLPYFCEMLVLQHRANPNSDWMINTSWFDHQNMIGSAASTDVLKSYDGARRLNSPFSKEYQFVESRVKEGLVVNTPWLLAHMSTCEVKWEDSQGGISEDTLFGRKLRSKYPTGHVYSSPTYLRCHYSGLWDV